MGGNGGPPFSDPRTLEQVVPQLRNTPAGAILAIPDSFFGITGPAQAAITSIHQAYTKTLIREIQAIDPNYHFETPGTAQTLQGQINEIKVLRFDRAAALYKVRGDTEALEVEVLRMMQDRADVAYEEAVKLYDDGRLPPRLSREEAIGNHIDLAVRAFLRTQFGRKGIDISRGQLVRVVGREYNSSVPESTYRIPDARVGKIAFDVTLTQKTLATAQVRGFFEADFRPDLVIIIRPSQLGAGNTYAITRPDR